MKKFITKQSLAIAALLFSSTGFAATVTVTPSTIGLISIGDNFSVTISGAGFPDTVGATLKLSFDPTIVAVRTPTLTNGIVLAAGSPFTGGIVAPTPFLTGNILSILAPTVGTLPNGAFNAFVVNFTALANGLANISLDDDQSDFSWTDATTFSAIPVDYTQASVRVGAVPAPPAVWLLGTAVVALAGRRLSRKAA